MANTIASHISASFIIQGTPIYDYGKVASTYSPGDCVYQAADGTWSHIDADTTAASLDYKVAVVGYKERILSTGAKSSIDTAYATTDTGIPILLGFQEGSGEFVCHIEDPAATVYSNGRFLASNTAGVFEALTAVAASAAGDTEAPFSNVDTLLTGDLYMKARWNG